MDEILSVIVICSIPSRRIQMDLSILNSKIDIISDLRLVWSNHRGSAEYDNNNNIITL